MLRFWGPIAALLIVTVVALDVLTPADAQQWTTPDRGFRVDWEPVTTKRGATVLRGYVRNDTGHHIGNLRLLIESLDASGAVATTTVWSPPGIAPAFDRLYFEVPLSAPATSYRVRVAAWDPVGRGQ
jgi:hypothetical protein